MTLAIAKIEHRDRHGHYSHLLLHRQLKERAIEMAARGFSQQYMETVLFHSASDYMPIREIAKLILGAIATIDACPKYTWVTRVWYKNSYHTFMEAWDDKDKALQHIIAARKIGKGTRASITEFDREKHWNLIIKGRNY